MIKIIPYRNKSIMLKNNKIFVFKESLHGSSDDSDSVRFNVRTATSFNTIEEAIDSIDKEYFDEYEMPTIVYQVITNPGEDDEHIEELTDLYLAQELFDGLKVDPDPSYKSMKLIKFDYEQDNEEILDFVDFTAETKEAVEENVDFDIEKTAKDEKILIRITDIIKKLTDYYNDFNERKDRESLSADLKSIEKSLEQTINYIQ